MVGSRGSACLAIRRVLHGRLQGQHLACYQEGITWSTVGTALGLLSGGYYMVGSRGSACLAIRRVLHGRLQGQHLAYYQEGITWLVVGAALGLLSGGYYMVDCRDHLGLLSGEYYMVGCRCSTWLAIRRVLHGRLQGQHLACYQEGITWSAVGTALGLLTITGYINCQTWRPMGIHSYIYFTIK